MWTPGSLIILKATTVHQPRGGPGPKQTSWPLTSDCPQDCPPHPANPSKTILSSFCPPLAHWGEPFHCPRQGVRYSSGGCGLSREYAEGDRWSKLEEGEKGSKVGGILEEAVVANQLCPKLDARSTPLPRLAGGLRIITEPHKVPDALASSSIDQHNNVGCRRPGRDQPGLNTRFPLLAKVAAAINHLNMIEAGKTITQGALAVATRSFA